MLIATDLDGTLLTPEGTISPRTRDAIRAAERVGVPVVPVTARQIYGIEKWRDDLGRWALCSNGAICWDLQAHTVLFRQLMSAAVANEFAHRLLAAAPGIRFLTIKDDGLTFASQRGYAGLTTFADHSRDPSDMPALDLDEVLDGNRPRSNDRLGNRKLTCPRPVLALESRGPTADHHPSPPNMSSSQESYLRDSRMLFSSAEIGS